MNFIPKKSTLTIVSENNSALIAIVSDTLSEIKYLVEPMPSVIAVADKPAKHSSIWDRFMSYTQKCCDDWCKNGYRDYI